MSRRERRHPDVTPVDPAECADTSRERMSAIGRIGGYARAAKMTPAELSEQGKRARAVRSANDAARRAAAGLPPVKPTPKPLSDDEMQYWLERVDEAYPDRVYTNRMQRRRAAIALAKAEAARLAAALIRSATGGTA